MQNKIIIVTGGASGIGLATAKKLSIDNNVIIADYKDINQDFIKDNFTNIDNVYYFKCDISKKENIISLRDFVQEKFNKLDCLVCNAGILPLPCGIDTITDDSIDRTIDVNLKGTFKCLNILGNFIKETSKTGSIVNISSVDGLIGEPYGVIYSTTKAGIISLTKSFARYFKGDIRVNCVAPGLIDTPLTDSTEEDPSWTTDYSIIKRIGKPEEIADSIIFLLSDKSSFITGQVLAVDGGFTLK